MAQSTAPIDPRTLSRWEDAFVYPISEVRLMERKLRSDLSANQEKLRGLVGQSYRDLLRTADMIIDMDSEVHRLERHFGEVTRQCNWRAVNRRSKNLKEFGEKSGDSERRKFVFAAQLGTLLACPSTISAFLQTRDFEPAAQLLTISRLLQKSIGTEANPKLTKKLNRQLAALHYLFNQALTDRLSSLEAQPIEIGRLLTSLSLLGNTSTHELLEQLLKLRSERIAAILAKKEDHPASLLDALKLLNKTLSDGEYLFPKRISDSLALLKARAVISSERLRNAHSLRLDVSESAFPDSIREFKPSMSHGNLQRTKMDSLLSTWIITELEKFNAAFVNNIGRVTALKDLLKFRKEILRTWGSNRSRFAASKAVMEFNPRLKYRDGLNKRAGDILESQAAGLAELGEILQNIDKTSTTSPPDSLSGLWSSSLVNMDIHNGARNFKNEILSQIQGRNADARTFNDRFNKWSKDLSEALESVKNLKKLQVDIEIDSSGLDDYDIDPAEEEEDEDNEDMRTLETASRTSIETAFKNLEEQLKKISDSIVETNKTGSSKSLLPRALFLLRSIKSLRTYHFPTRPLSTWFCTPILNSLHKVIAFQVSFTPLATYRSALQRRAWNTAPEFDSLREGNPRLPAQPTPVTFSFLRRLLEKMTEAGDDVWDAEAVEALVGVARGVLVGVYRTEIEKGIKVEDEKDGSDEKAAETAEGNEENKAEGESEDNKPASEAEKDESKSGIAQEWLDHVLFDAALLEKVLAIPSLASGSEITTAVKDALKIPDKDTSDISKNAEAYWKRTSLLFSLTG